MTDGSTWRFSAVAFGLAVVTIGVGTAAGLAFVPVVGSYLGMLVGGLVAGAAIEKRALPESGVAAVLANLGLLSAGAMIGNGVGAGLSALVSIPPLTLLISIVLSFVVGAFGAHFGDDLRDGLTAPVESSPSRTPDTGVTAPAQTDEEEQSDPVIATEGATDDGRPTDRTDDRTPSHEPESPESEELELERE